VKEKEHTSDSSVVWLTSSVLGIVLATYLSDFSHEACTAVLPLYLAAIGLGPGALGLIEGLADFLVSISKLGGGLLGQRVRHKRPWAAVGYALTGAATACIGLVHSTAAIVSLRCVAWIARGYRGPLRDSMMADAVPRTHYGRAFGLERAGDMLGAVSGPLIAALLVWVGWARDNIILLTVIPGLAAAAAFYFLTREKTSAAAEPASGASTQRLTREKTSAAAEPASGASTQGPAIPARFWQFLVGVFFFGLGDFSRTFLIYLAAQALGEDKKSSAAMISLAVLLYAFHNLISALAAYIIGHLADRVDKLRLLVAGYALGVVTNGLLGLAGGSIAWLVVALILSAIYLAAEQTLEKAAAAEFLPREQRSLGFGILASSNAVGDMVSSLAVGFLLQFGRPEVAFGSAAAVGACGVIWLFGLVVRENRQP